MDLLCQINLGKRKERRATIEVCLRLDRDTGIEFMAKKTKKTPKDKYPKILWEGKVGGCIHRLVLNRGTTVNSIEKEVSWHYIEAEIHTKDAMGNPAWIPKREEDYPSASRIFEYYILGILGLKTLDSVRL